MRRSIAPSLMALLLMPACGGGGDGAPQSAVPAPASALDAKLKTNMVRFVPMVGNIESSLVAVLNPGTPMAQGVVVAPDTQAGAAPHSVVFSGPYDGNGDGIDETTLSSGRAHFFSDPATGWSGLDGSVRVDVSLPLLGHVYHADVAFTILPDQKRLSGSGTFTEPLGGNTVTMTVAANSPLVVRAADGSPTAVSNACGNSLSGQMRLVTTGATGSLSSIFNFDPTRASVAVTGSSFTDTTGQTTALPDSSVDLRCGSGGSINDWVATFDQDWVCLPRESGRARLTLTVAGPDSVTIEDEDPPGSGDKSTYQASLLGGNPYALRGFFIGGPAGNQYREDFNWTLSKDGKRFSQFSQYVYIEGANLGKGGYCVGAARRN